jgi:hypothetical protein
LSMADPFDMPSSRCSKCSWCLLWRLPCLLFYVAAFACRLLFSNLLSSDALRKDLLHAVMECFVAYSGLYRG